MTEFHRETPEGPVLEIRMQAGRPTGCWNCGAECGGDNCGLPVWNGEVVPNDWEGEWGGVPCCQQCYDLHERGLIPTRNEVVKTAFGTFPIGGG